MNTYFNAWKANQTHFSEVEHWLRDRHKFLSNLHEEWTNRLRDEVAAKEAELQALIAARNADK